MKEDKIRKKEMTRLKSLAVEVREREKELAEREKRKAQLRDERKDRTRKLGKLKYPLLNWVLLSCFNFTTVKPF